MCGIVGYVGEQHPKEILINGLKKLEYRGYDSSGIALVGDKGIQIIKALGRIVNLEEKLDKEKVVDSHLGIAHTRWATHGGVTENNAHPHRIGKVTLVHNGILENAAALKEDLIKEGVKFNSDTDSEVVAALLDKYLKDNDVLKAIDLLTKDLKGSYALGIMIDGDNTYPAESAKEIKQIIDTCYEDTKRILIEKKNIVEGLATRLIDKLTVDGPDFEKIYEANGDLSAVYPQDYSGIDTTSSVDVVKTEETTYVAPAPAPAPGPSESVSETPADNDDPIEPGPTD